MGYIITSWYKDYIVSLDMYSLPDSWTWFMIIYLYGDWKFLVFYIIISRNFLYDSGAFEHIFCTGGGELEKPDLKSSNSQCLSWIDRYISQMPRGGWLRFGLDGLSINQNKFLYLSPPPTQKQII